MKHTGRSKRWHCKTCAKQYCFIRGAFLHNLKAHEGKAKFGDLQVLRVGI